jgi:pimeloyl-ACP methyl ester carboxylesterase
VHYESRHVNWTTCADVLRHVHAADLQGQGDGADRVRGVPSQYDNRGLTINRDPALARKSAETRYNVVHATIAPKGGHFPALEQPQAWMDDLRTFVRGLASQ